MGIRGDVAATAERLTATLRERGVDGSDARWTKPLRERLARASVGVPPESNGGDGRADPRRLLSRLDEALPDDRIVVTDGGHFTNWIMDYIDVTDPESFIWTLDFSSIGRGLPISIGAGTAVQDRACLAFCGDAGLMMSLSELDTAARQSIPLYVVVLNDGAYGAEYHQLDLVDKHPESALVETPDIPALAEGFGGVGYELTAAADVASLDLPTRPDGPVVLDCHVTRSVRHRFYEEYHGI